MSLLTDLLDKAKSLEAEVSKEGTVLVGDAEAKVKDLVESLEHEVQKEVTETDKPAQTADAPAAPAASTSGVNTSSDIHG